MVVEYARLGKLVADNGGVLTMSDDQGSDDQGSDDQGSDDQGSDDQGSDDQGSDDQGSGGQERLRGGDRNYRAFVGHASRYDVLAGLQFNLLTMSGLREGHRVLDIGCGSLRLGRLLLPYLAPGNYYGIEPEEWLLQEGVERELGEDQIARRRPTFSSTRDYDLASFGVDFDRLIAHSVFTHAPQADVRRCLAAAADVMTESSGFFATFHLGSPDYAGDEWVYPALVPYSTRWIEESARSAGLRATALDWPHPHRQNWFLFTRKGAPRESVRRMDPVRGIWRATLAMRARRTPLVGAVLRRRVGTTRSEPAQSEPAQSEPAQSEPAQSEPAQSEPGQ
jgi:SAM-dependent methyltransferase